MIENFFNNFIRKEKLQQIVDKQWLSEEQFDILLNHPLIDEEVANSLIENVIAQGALPIWDFIPNIIVDDKAYVVPMMVEEP